MQHRPLLLAGLGCALLGGCHKPRPAANSLDAMDSALVNAAAANDANALSPATITVDRGRLARKGGGSGSALGTLAERQQDAQAPGARTIRSPMAGDCGGTLTYSNAWAKELPADLPLPPGAHVTEAAGKDGGCLVRVVSMTAPVGAQAILDWWKTRATTAGYTTGPDREAGELILSGYRAKDGASFKLMVGKPGDSRTPVDLVWAR